MRALTFPPLLLLLAISPQGCERGPVQSAAPAASVKTSAATVEARKAEIRAQIAKVCPVILRPSELERAATLVDRLASDAEVIATVQRLFRFDSEARVCRGLQS